MSRPLGITIVSIVLTIAGVIQILVGFEIQGITNLWLEKAASVAGYTGWSAIVTGVLTLIVAAGLFTLAGWAWLVAVAVMVIRIVSDLYVGLTHGFSSAVGYVSVAEIVVSAIVLIYLTRRHVRTAFGR